jgi:hypothetical protein
MTEHRYLYTPQIKSKVHIIATLDIENTHYSLVDRAHIFQLSSVWLVSHNRKRTKRDFASDDERR